MPRYKESERKEARSDTRRALLKAATEAFASQGYHSANVNQISKAAGFAKGTIYNYFESKQALMLALIEDFSTAHYDFIAGQVLQEETADRRVERFFEAGYAFVAAHFAQGLVMVHNLNGPDRTFKEAMNQAYQPMFHLVSRDIIAFGISKGVFREVEPFPTAGLMMLLYLGVASNVDEEGKPWVRAGQVAGFVLNALKR